MKEFVVYTALRLVLFLGSLGIVIGLWSAVSDEVPVFWAVVLAFVISGVGSFFLLNRQREAFAHRVELRAARASAKIEEMRAKEDVDEPEAR